VRVDSLKIKNHPCFSEEWTGFDSLKKFNVIIGKNNSGKSLFLDLIRQICGKSIYNQNYHFQYSGKLSEYDLKQEFPVGVKGGQIPGYHWDDHGLKFLGVLAKWDMDSKNNITSAQLVGVDNEPADIDTKGLVGRKLLNILKKQSSTEIDGSYYSPITAERDIKPETENREPSLLSNGDGATNLIRKFLLSSDSLFPRELVSVELLQALNEVFNGDAIFTEIYVQHHDSEENDYYAKKYEIYLGEENKGLINLSKSGSGLKTILLVLINLILVPPVFNKNQGCVFAFEELENNIHPSLLRNLIRFIINYSKDNTKPLFFTTHSSIMLDMFSKLDDTQIIHISHDGKSGKAEIIETDKAQFKVLDDLGVKPSDLLQANGVIWVEGPSDRIYINKWIELFSEGEFEEGTHYQIAFYGGALLANIEFKTPDEALNKMVNLFRINSNIIVICDSDKNSENDEQKDRVTRIENELKEIPNSLFWVTAGKEIENYLYGGVLQEFFGEDSLPDVNQYESFYPKEKIPNSYISDHTKRKSVDKSKLAIVTTQHMTIDKMNERFDWKNQMEKVIQTIEHWNS